MVESLNSVVESSGQSKTTIVQKKKILEMRGERGVASFRCRMLKQTDPLPSKKLFRNVKKRRGRREKGKHRLVLVCSKKRVYSTADRIKKVGTRKEGKTGF